MRLFKIAKRAFQTAEDVQVKGWYVSKTVWVNAIALLGLLLVHFGLLPAQWSPEIQGELAAAVLTIINVALRVVTTRPVGTKTKKSEHTKTKEAGSRNPKP